MQTTVRIGLLNLWCFSGSRLRDRQVEVIFEAALDVLCLLEVNPTAIAEFASACGFAWWRCSVGVGARARTLAVAVVGNGRTIFQGELQLTVDDFPEVPPAYLMSRRRLWLQQTDPFAMSTATAESIHSRLFPYIQPSRDQAPASWKPQKPNSHRRLCSLPDGTTRSGASRRRTLEP